jgi:hypothetical protein
MRELSRAWGPRLIRCGVVIVGAMLAVLSASRAETPEQRQACTDDAFQLCSDAMPDRERVFACLVEKRNLISPLCREGMAAFLPPEPAPAVQRVNRPKTKASDKTKTKKTKPDTKTKAAGTKAGAPLSLAPKSP